MHKEAFWNWPMSRFPIQNGSQFPDVRFCGLDVCAGLPVFIVPNSRCADRQVISRETSTLEFRVRRKTNAHAFIPRLASNLKPRRICGGWFSRRVEVFNFGMSLAGSRAKARPVPSTWHHQNFRAAPFAGLRFSTVSTHSSDYNTCREWHNGLLFNVEVAERATAVG